MKKVNTRPSGNPEGAKAPAARSGTLPARINIHGNAFRDSWPTAGRPARPGQKPGAGTSAAGGKPVAKGAPAMNKPAAPGKPAPVGKPGRPMPAGRSLPVGQPATKVTPAMRRPAVKGALAKGKVAPPGKAGPARRRTSGPIADIDAFKGVNTEPEAPVSPEADQPFRSGFVALVGRPNVGKSTLLNQMVGTKVAIMSDKPQTTRNRILGVVNRTNSQMVFMDTPGIHKPLHRMGELLNRTAQATLPEVDVVLFLVDGADRPGEGDKYVSGLVQQSGKPAILVVNKMDRVPREKWYEVMDTYKALGENWLHVVPVSALEGKNVPDLAALIEEQLEEGPQYYPEDMVSDRPERFVMAELVREQILHRTYEEIPHSVAVDIEEMVERDNGTVYCRATILVERESQRGILIGEGGQMLKEVGAAARADAERLLGSKMFLELWVKVKEDWRNRESFLNQLGLNEE